MFGEHSCDAITARFCFILSPYVTSHWAKNDLSPRMLANIDELRARLHLQSQTLDWHLYSQNYVTKFAINRHLLVFIDYKAGKPIAKLRAMNCVTRAASNFAS